MKQRGLLSFLLIVVLVGCDKPKPVVVLDGWWDVDYAKQWCSQANHWHQENAALVAQVGCDKVTSCPEMMTIADACTPDPIQEVRKFENDLATEFASSEECRFVQFVYFSDPKGSSKAASDAMQKLHYSLSLDFIPGARKQQWKMLSSPNISAFTQGEGSPQEIAKKVCFIVKERGATLAN